MTFGERGDEGLHPDARRVADALREPVAVRPAWRDAVLRAIETAPAPAARGAASESGARRIALTPGALAAAALVCIALGAAGALAVSGGRPAAVTRDAAQDAPFRLVADARPLGASRAGGTMVRFVIVAPNAARVSVVGNFNAWNPAAAPMHRVDGGDAWVRDVALEPGRHVYAFVVDGTIHIDPTAPRAAEDDFGIPSSAIVVPAVSQ